MLGCPVKQSCSYTKLEHWKVDELLSIWADCWASLAATSYDQVPNALEAEGNHLGGVCIAGIVDLGLLRGNPKLYKGHHTPLIQGYAGIGNRWADGR